MSWLETSIMARRGLAKGKPGKTYAITEESQGQYHYVYGPFAKPVLKVDPGSVISAETHDAFEGKIKYEDRQAERDSQLPVPESAERADLCQRRREGRYSCGVHQVDRAARPAAGGNDLPDQGIRRPGRDRRHRAAQSPVAGTGQEGRGHAGRRHQMERQDHAAL